MASDDSSSWGAIIAILVIVSLILVLVAYMFFSTQVKSWWRKMRSISYRDAVLDPNDESEMVHQQMMYRPQEAADEDIVDERVYLTNKGMRRYKCLPDGRPCIPRTTDKDQL